MLYLYDKAICDDLSKSFNPDSGANSIVKVIDPEGAIQVVAQLQNDEVQFPAVMLTRSEDFEIDSERWNFTRAHKGVPVQFDNTTNELYYEKAVPIKLNYSLTLLTTNIADRDELIRELIMKYTNMYFLKIKLPYECDRYIRFGIRADFQGMQHSSGSFNYLQSGQLYQTIIPLNCEGCVMVTYTPVKLKRTTTFIEPLNPRG